MLISIYADGSSTGGSNRPGGYGFLVVAEEQVLLWGYGGSPSTTNNLMEMAAATHGLQAVLQREWPEGTRFELVSDSEYTLGLACGRFDPSCNVEEARQLRELTKRLGCTTRWVKGHAGDRFNEIADKLAKQGKVENLTEQERLLIQARLEKKRSKKSKRSLENGRS